MPGAYTAVGSYNDANGDQAGLTKSLSVGSWTPTSAPLPRHQWCHLGGS
jgi:hypothetical protein